VARRRGEATSQARGVRQTTGRQARHKRSQAKGTPPPHAKPGQTQPERAHEADPTPARGQSARVGVHGTTKQQDGAGAADPPLGLERQRQEWPPQSATQKPGPACQRGGRSGPRQDQAVWALRGGGCEGGKTGWNCPRGRQGTGRRQSSGSVRRGTVGPGRWTEPGDAGPNRHGEAQSGARGQRQSASRAREPAQAADRQCSGRRARVTARRSAEPCGTGPRWSRPRAGPKAAGNGV